jgi:hypothetical protein
MKFPTAFFTVFLTLVAVNASGLQHDSSLVARNLHHRRHVSAGTSALEKKSPHKRRCAPRSTGKVIERLLPFFFFSLGLTWICRTVTLEEAPLAKSLVAPASVVPATQLVSLLHVPNEKSRNPELLCSHTGRE